MRDIEYGTIGNQQSPQAEELSVDILLNSPGLCPFHHHRPVTPSVGELKMLSDRRCDQSVGPRGIPAR